MHRSKSIFLFLLPVLLLTSCIKSFEPLINSSDLGKYIVSGTISDADSIQTVSISMTSKLEDHPQDLTVTGCIVTITDDQGHTFPLTDNGDGTYSTSIDPVYLHPGASFMVTAKTPDGTEIQSDFDRMPSCPPVDSIYFEELELPTEKENIFIRGIQLYVDFKGEEDNSRYYRFDAVETWEYHSEYPLEWYYDGTVHHVFPADFSRMKCWTTKPIRNVYTLSTRNLSENRFKGISLNFVDNKTSRLAYCYSLLLNQYSLSEAAYNYWEQIRINSVESGGLYEQQPLPVKGNMHNLSNPDIKILGFFGASSVKSKRIFIKDIKDLQLDYYNGCNPRVLMKGFKEISKASYPAYLMGDAGGYQMVWLNRECIDCVLRGGTNVKPDFWPY